MMKIDKDVIYALKYFLVFACILLVFFAWSGYTGYTLLGASSEKWSPDGKGTHNNSSTTRIRYHK